MYDDDIGDLVNRAKKGVIMMEREGGFIVVSAGDAPRMHGETVTHHVLYTRST